MEKLDSAFGQWIVLYTHYFDFQFSYLHTFYKSNNIKTKPSTNVKSADLQINIPPWTKGVRNEERMEKFLKFCFVTFLMLQVNKIWHLYL